MKLIAEQAWLGGGADFLRTGRVGGTTLAEVLRRLAREHLRRDGGQVRLVLENDVSAAERVRHWRHLSLTLPVDLLLGALAQAEKVAPVVGTVTIPPPLLERALREHPVAEVHVHLKAAIPFDLMWINGLQVFARPDAGEGLANVRDTRALPISDPKNTFGDAHGMTRWLGATGVVRAVLARFLGRRRSEETLQEFVTRVLESGGRGGRAVRQCLCALRDGVSVVELSVVLRATAEVMGGRPAPEPEDVATLLANDAVRRYLQCGHAGAAPPEQALIVAALEYLEGAGTGDAAFERLFWQMVRVRGMVFRYLTQEPGVSGLLWFTTWFERIRGLRRGLGGGLVAEAALQLEQEGMALRSFEARTSPEKSAQGFVGVLKGFEKGCGRVPDEGGERECGVVVHFNKPVEELSASERHPGWGRMRFESLLNDVHRHETALLGAIGYSGQVLETWRGLDVCGVELMLPVWVFVGPIRRVRAAAQRAASRRGRAPLGLTLHAGEDFHRLMEGLRRVDEVLEFVGVGHGDRLGHGLALGVDPRRWAEREHVTLQPAEERLDDLLWELSLYRRGTVTGAGARIAYVEAEALRVGRRLYGDCRDLTADALIEARLLRHDGRPWTRRGRERMAEALEQGTGCDAAHLLARYLLDGGVSRRGQAPMEVVASVQEVEALEAIQRLLRHRVASVGVVIEVNPSSNLLIGDDVLAEHPVFRLCPLPDGESKGGEPVMIALGDDDPLCFATRLQDEYGYLYYALQQRGVGTERALAWIERVRENGWRARFTRSLVSGP